MLIEGGGVARETRFLLLEFEVGVESACPWTFFPTFSRAPPFPLSSLPSHLLFSSSRAVPRRVRTARLRNGECFFSRRTRRSSSSVRSPFFRTQRAVQC